MKGTLNDPVRVMKRAMVFASGNAGRPILCAVHLDECGDVVATDSYRLYVEQGAWSGPSVDIDYATAYDIAHCKVRGNDTAELEVDGERVDVRMGDGTKIVGGCLEGKYPDYGKLFPSGKPSMTAYMRVKEALPIVEAHRKKKSAVRVESACRDLVMCGANGDVEPGYRVEKACDGEDMAVALNAEFLKSALKAVGEYAEVRVWGATKPVVVTWDGNDRKAPTVLLMPVRFEVDAEPKVKEKVGTGKKEEQVKTGENITVECFGRGFYASHPKGTRLTEGGGEVAFVVGDAYRYRFKGRDYAASFLGYDTYKGERKLLFAVFKDGVWQGYLRTVAWAKLKALANNPLDEEKEEKVEKAIELKGQVVCITGTLPGMTRNEAFIRLKAVGGEPCERFTKKVTLMVRASSAGKSKLGKLDKAIADGQKVRVIDGHEFLEALKAAEAEQTAKAIEQAAKRRGAKVEAKVTEHADVKAFEMVPKKEDGMEKRIAELEKELKAARKELDAVWKENAQLKAKKQEPKSVPPAPKAPKSEDAAAVVSLESMQKWCEGKGLKAKQTNEKASIWVLGPSTPYKKELEDMGARWGTSKKYGKGWYIAPSAA